MARLGLVKVKGAMLMSQRRLMDFWTTRLTFHIQEGYTFIWNNLQKLVSLYEPIPNLDGGSHELDWILVEIGDWLLSQQAMLITSWLTKISGWMKGL
mgnify:CR=1 FL=1